MSTEYENMQVEKWVNLEDVAEHLSLSQDTVRTWIKEGKLPVYKAGKRYKFKISEVDEWVREGKIKEQKQEVDLHMNPKMKSAIEKIMLNDATFSNEVIEPTYVNFFYGKNGAGKSTIARALKAGIGVQWDIGQNPSDYDVLVYDTDFIDANLKNYGDLAGVFTVNETNIAIQEQVEKLNAERKKMGEDYQERKLKIQEKTTAKTDALIKFQTDCWNKTTELRKIFDASITGKKKTALFAEEILKIMPVVHDFET